MEFTLKPVEGSTFVDRKELVEEMLQTLSSKNVRIGYALYGKRRVGKTSVFKEVKRRLKKDKFAVPVYFSVWNLVSGSVNEFVRELSVAIIDAYNDQLSLKYKAKQMLEAPLSLLKEVIKNIKITVKIKEDMEFLLSFNQKEEKDVGYLIERVFELAENLAKETSTKCILFIDEFPSIINLKNGSKIGDGIIKKIRTIYEGCKNTELCISGSIKKTMEIAVLSSASAFYRQLIVKEVKPLTKEYNSKIITNKLENVSEEALDAIYEFTKGIPFYTQFIGRGLEKIKTNINKKEVETAINQLLTEEGNILFKEEFERLSPKEKVIVLSMAKEDLSSPAKIAESINENTNQVAMFLSYLEEKGILSKEERGFYLLDDPVFKEWLIRRYGTQ